MHLDETILRAYLDEELSPQDMVTVRQLLAESVEAQSLLDLLNYDSETVNMALDCLAIPNTVRGSSHAGWNRFQHQLSQPNMSIIDELQFMLDASVFRSVEQFIYFLTHIQERIMFFMNNRFIKQYQPWLAAFAIVAVVGILFSFAPVRAMAGQLLKIFRVQNVAVVPFNAELLEGNTEMHDLLKQFSPESEIIVDGGEPQVFDTLDEAIQHVNFEVSSIPELPADVGDEFKAMVDGESIVSLMLDRELLQSVFQSAKIEIELPASLDDTPIVINKPTMLGQMWGTDLDDLNSMQGERPRSKQRGKRPAHSNHEAPQLMFVQMPTPHLEYPDDLDLATVGVAGLQLLGMPKIEAIALGSTIDWENTMILPIPIGEDIDATEISISGNSGVVMTMSDNDHVTIIWATGEMTYMLVGKYDTETLISLAESVD